MGRPLVKTCCMCALVFLGPAVAEAQFYGYSNAGSTPAGDYLNGLGNTIRAQGQYNLLTSEAAVNLEEVQKRDIENRQRWTNTYFEMRRVNEAYQASKKPAPRSPGDWVRMAHEDAPARLPVGALDPITGRIAWPSALSEDEYKQDRAVLESLFAERAMTHGAIGMETYAYIRKSVDNMLTKLKSHIREVDPRYYVEAKEFLTSLAREADFPAHAAAMSPAAMAPAAAPPAARPPSS